VWAPRKRDSDARSFYSSGRVFGRAFAVDWSRCNTERFRGMVAKDDDGGAAQGDTELAEVRAVLAARAPLIYAMFSYYCVASEGFDRYVMGESGFGRLVGDARLADASSRSCKLSDLDTVFISTNYEDRTTSSLEARRLNDANPDRALMRFEFLQLLVRLAVAKYVRDERCELRDVSEALELLFSEVLEPRLPPEARHAPDAFRRRRLYTRGASDVFARNEASLRAVFEIYAAGADELVVTSEGRLMSDDEWEQLLVDVGLLEQQLGAAFGRREAALCFVWAQTFVTDEQKRRQKLTHLRYEDFLEAVARVTTFKPLPTAEQLRAHKAGSAAHFFRQAEQGLHEGRALLKPVDWREEEQRDESLVEKLEMLLSIILERLDEDKDGAISKKDLASRRKALANKQKGARTD